MMWYLVCELDDEDYAYPTFTTHASFDDAEDYIKSEINEYFANDKIEHREKGRYDAIFDPDYDGHYRHFYIYEVLEVEKPYALIYHHAYNGVDFLVDGQFDTKEEALKAIKARAKEIADNIEGFEEFNYPYEDGDEDFVADNNVEWECLNIVEREVIL